MKINRRRKVSLLKAYYDQLGECFYCNRRAWLPWEDNSGDLRLMATREHLVRQCDGGTDDDENIAMACADCNSRRGATPPSDWIESRSLNPTDLGCVTIGSYLSPTYDFDAVAHFHVHENKQETARKRSYPKKRKPYPSHDERTMKAVQDAVSALDAWKARREGD